ETLKRRVKKLEKKQKSRTYKLKRLYKERISDIDADDDITLVSTHDEQMFDVNQDLGGKEVFVAQQDEKVVEKEVDAAQIQVTTIVTTPTILIDEATLAQALAELKHVKPKAKAKGIVFHEPEESTTITTTATIPKSKSQDKGKAKRIEKPRKGESFLLLRELNKREVDHQQKLTKEYHEYLSENMDGWKIKSLKKKSFVEIQELFNKAMKKVNTFVDFRTELVEESSKKAKTEITQEGSLKRTKDEMEQERSNKMLKNFDREDQILWRLVKARFEKIKPVNHMDSFLLHNLKTVFEHHVEDNNILYYLWVEKMYPLTNHTLHQMFNDVKLQVNYECKMAYELLRLVKK
nr:hypothetical protein [Tanacetum cinerariifolium]